MNVELSLPYSGTVLIGVARKGANAPTKSQLYRGFDGDMTPLVGMKEVMAHTKYLKTSVNVENYSEKHSYEVFFIVKGTSLRSVNYHRLH